MCTLSGGKKVSQIVFWARTERLIQRRREGLFRSVMCSPLEEIGVEIGEKEIGS